MTVIFDGKSAADYKEALVEQEVRNLKSDFDIIPKLVIILIGENSDNLIYTNLKQKAADRIGAKLVIKKFDSNINYEEIINFIKLKNKDNKVHGIMVQLPLPKKLEKYKTKIINNILLTKDIDGLRNKSNFIHPTVSAILEIIEIGVFNNKEKIVVVGSKGMVGSKLIRELKNNNYKYIGLDVGSNNIKKIIKTADILITCTGEANLIKPDMIKNNVFIIDVGYPKGDVGKKVYEKAKFITPVPGGVGPVTIACLMENLISSANKLIIANNTH